VRARLSVAWLWLLVALQVAIPASYYLVRDDRDDERFAWRMFSSVRLTRCRVRAFDGKTPQERAHVDLATYLHASWQRSLERGRKHVIERFLSARCGQPGVVYSQLERSCTSPSGRVLPDKRYRYDCPERRFEAAR
jgi:hypothetical protein